MIWRNARRLKHLSTGAEPTSPNRTWSIAASGLPARRILEIPEVILKPVCDRSSLVSVFTNTFEGPRRVSEHSETIHLSAERLTPRAGPAARDMSSTIQLASFAGPLGCRHRRGGPSKRDVQVCAFTRSFIERVIGVINRLRSLRGFRRFSAVAVLGWPQ